MMVLELLLGHLKKLSNSVFKSNKVCVTPGKVFLQTLGIFHLNNRNKQNTDFCKHFDHVLSLIP